MELPQKAYRGCIFDFDGVVVDTERYHFASWNEAGALMGATLTWEEYLPLKSTGKETIIRRIAQNSAVPLTDELRAQMARRKDESFQSLIRSLSPSDILPGAEAFLGALTAGHIPLAVASSSAATTRIARDFGLDRYFRAIIDGNSDLPRKPAPDLFLAAAQALGLKPAECLVFEDSLAGIEAAGNAGMDVVAVGGIRSEKAIAQILDFRGLRCKTQAGYAIIVPSPAESE